ncbi:hypothetical protein IB257_20330 [Achromobacter sp. ACM03]|uniref:hypothetical protein n=1 Tax=Achromobacter TaxID=222 RepID=UPI0015843EE5|nr:MULTISPECIES: hypothetical protein [Achromobacter]MBD9383653.1 hypothetical protein [Achromobacter sp. ACM02]MBD9432293.1 hypothetical protein [Achromobacter sp. ACM03]MBD9475538.1 hypothetical protein [Achromobacter sp. ACM01]
MSFSMDLSHEVLTRFDEEGLLGEIEINGYKENFFSPVRFWSRMDYLKSWKKSLDQGLQSHGHAALATSMYDPNSSNFVFCWVIYIESEQAYIQNHVIFLNELSVPFVPEDINLHIYPREEISEDGMKISQWSVDTASVAQFSEMLGKWISEN